MSNFWPFTSFKSFSHGIHPPDEKMTTRHLPIRRLPFAPELIILMNQHLGKPSVPVVAAGQEVKRGQIIAKADGFLSVPIHSPASGIVKKVDNSLDMNGKMIPSIFITPFPWDDQVEDLNPPEDIWELSAKEIIQAVYDMGMVGLGGAAFPTHIKFNPPKEYKVDTFILNACECEPYLTSDHRVMLEFPDEIILGTRLILKALSAKKAIIAIEHNKQDAAELLESKISKEDPIKVEVLQTKYPQGAEKMLTRAVLGEDIPSGKIPASIGVMVSNITTVAEIGHLLPRGQALIERVVTLSGKGIKKPGNYLVPLGTPLDFVLKHGGLSEGAKEVVIGGPMMGKAVSFLDTPITKGVSGILALDKNEKVTASKVYPCIKCGECVRSCPIHLNPSRMGIFARKDEYEKMESLNLFDCFECGCCSYVCPSNIPLVQLFRMAKGALKERKSDQ